MTALAGLRDLSKALPGLSSLHGLPAPWEAA